MEVKELTDTKSKFISSLEHQGTDGMWISSEVIADAKQVIEVEEFPTTRNEAWKYTRVGRIVNGTWKVSNNTSQVDTRSLEIPELHAIPIVLENGFIRQDLSDFQKADNWFVLDGVTAPEEIAKKSGSLATHEGQIFSAVNAVCNTAGIVVHAGKGVQVPNVIHINNLISENGLAAFPRILVVAEESSEVEIVVSSNSEFTSFTNAVMEVFVGENASVTIHKLQSEGENSFQVSTEAVSQEANSRFTISTITSSGGWVRNDLNIKIKGQGCETNLVGTYFPKNKDHVDNHTTVDHMVPHCESNELYKGVIHDKATGVFNGKVFVREDAQKINAFQQNANILMSNDATMNSKPELEIYADDVQCSHGSTTGQFDEEAVFYLKSRGLSDESARLMLVQAFASEVLEFIKNDPIRDHAESLLFEE